MESRLQRMQTSMHTNSPTVTLVSSETTLSTDTNLSSGMQLIKQVLCYAVFFFFFPFNDLRVEFND